MGHHEAEASQQTSCHGEVGVLPVLFEVLIGFFKIAWAVLLDLVGGLDEVILEDPVAANGRLALVGFFVRASALFAARDDSGVGAKLFARVYYKAGSEFRVNPGGECDSDAANGE